MPKLVMSSTYGDLVKREYMRDFDREAITLMPRAEGYQLGAVLGKVTATGKYALCVATANDGSELPCAVLIHDVPESTMDTEAVAFVRGPVILISDFLRMDASLDSTKPAVLAQLAAFGMVARPLVQE